MISVINGINHELTKQIEMKVKKFLKVLRKYYNTGIGETNIHCKFWAQANSFSFALYKKPKDSTIMSFTKSNEIYISDVYYDWARKCDSQDRKEILHDIRSSANRMNRL